MRPLQLSFSGMRSYAGRCGPLDFTGKNLVGILGDTGAGKSTILEAITFALYGSPSWTNRDVAPLVADGATAMTVDLTFAHEGQRWRVRRTFHAGTTPTSHLLANLDTEETFDNAGPVNRKIESLLNMNFNSFRAAVLLPQGRFDRLLTATGRDRTELLKGIFGTHVIETMQGRATEYRVRLADLLNEARLARRDLLADPASEADAARTGAEQAERKNARLTQALKDLREAQGEAVRMCDRRVDLTNMLTELERHRIDAAATIGTVRPAAQRLDAEAEELGARKQAAANRLDGAKARLEEAGARRETPSSLGSAEAVLSGVPARLAALADERDELAREDQRLVGDAAHLAVTETDLAEARTAATERDARSVTAAQTLSRARASLRLLRDAAGTVLVEAVAVARSAREAEAAERNVESCRHALPGLRTAVDEAESALTSADEQLEAVRRGEAAHLLGAHLSAGVPCPVCVRPVPGDYRAPDALEPQALRSAQHAREARTDGYSRAAKALSQAEARLETAEGTAAQRRRAAEESRSRLDHASEDLVQIAHGDVWSLGEARTWDRPAFTAALDTAITTLRARDPAEGDRLRGKVLLTFLGPAEAFEQALAEAAEAARMAAVTAGNRAENLESSLRDLRKSHDEATRRASNAKQRHTAAEKRLHGDLDDLPDIARRALPGELLQLSTGDIGEARRAVSERHEELDALVRDQGGAQADLTEFAKRQRTLDQRYQAEVAKPLQSLLTGLDRWTETIRDAARLTGQAHARPAVPRDPTVDAARVYADAVTRSAAEVRRTLRAALTDVSARAEGLVAELTAQASTLLDDDDRSAGGGVMPHEVDPLDATFLDPLKDAATTARNEALRRRTEQAEAESQIERAQNLDTAIGAGEARHAAVDRLRSLLTEAKFQHYLIDQRTLALLGLASDIFGQLSDGQFGFGPEFQIVSRASNTSRSPKTLSGGETFLASLALALALVELYSRTGTRLGALFLDEGFGSLDVDTLARALAVLRSETGADKLVTVISHLHAVAEAVEDVLWVERRPAGSEARWLNSRERDALVREDVSAGLLRLA
jgi:exonuclease SbcC